MRIISPAARLSMAFAATATAGSLSAAPLTCTLETGRTLEVELGADGGPCRFGFDEGRMRGDVCRIQNPQLRLLTVDGGTGALVYEDTDNDRITRGSCRGG